MSANTINNRNTNFLLLFKIHYSLQALNKVPLISLKEIIRYLFQVRRKTKLETFKNPYCIETATETSTIQIFCKHRKQYNNAVLNIYKSH